MLKELIAYDYNENRLYRKAIGLADDIVSNKIKYDEIISKEYSKFAGQVSILKQLQKVLDSENVIDIENIDQVLLDNANRNYGGFLYFCIDNRNIKPMVINNLNDTHKFSYTYDKLTGHHVYKDSQDYNSQTKAYLFSQNDEDYNRNVYSMVISFNPYCVWLFTNIEDAKKYYYVLTNEFKIKAMYANEVRIEK